ncbi:hypothetical protein [Paraburkholderia youngii]|uniref:hypothetical protein n=1 Tax=Paraburkholderia youngii TaxID=2782701 RepID=UPI0015922E88|nr:hypothetical protein [Paraburkholderia youngii]NUX58653.1 hypothetical protein [Paraburkholderia youngii]
MTTKKGPAGGEFEPVQTQYFPLAGGLDQTSPTLSLAPGMVRDALNFECATTGGYTRIMGYERYDGHPSPSAQTYWTLNGTITANVGDTITGVTSGATAVVAMIDTTTVPGTTYIVVTMLTGSFAAGGENVTKSGTVVGSITGAEQRAGAPNASTDVQYQVAAANIYRNQIGVVPGSGQVLGVWVYNDTVYAFRNNVAGTAANMYKATVNGWALVTTPTLQPGGHYEFVNANFGGSAQTMMMFGCDSVNKAFQFDGTTFTQITTGMTVDAPNHIEYHKNYLFLAFGASLQYSPLGNPTGTWTVVLGAGEIALGETITSIRSYIGNNSYIGTESTNALLIHTKSTTQVLYGASSSDFSLSKHSATSGAVANSVQIADQPYYMSDLGIVNLQVTQAYGNFLQSALSQTINPFITQERTRISASCVVRAKSQYRLFFNDDYALYVTFLNGKVLGMMICNLGIAMRCVASVKLSDNSEVIYAGSDSGYVYQLEKGPNFDGQPILAYLNMVFAAFKSPRIRKRWRKAVLEMRGTGYFEYQVAADLAWASTDIAPDRPVLKTSQLSGVNWDSFVWDQFYWDGVNNAPTETVLDGTGENIGLRVLSQSAYFQSFTVASAIFHFSMRRQLR